MRPKWTNGACILPHGVARWRSRLGPGSGERHDAREPADAYPGGRLGQDQGGGPEPDVQPAREIVVDEKKVGKVHHIRTARGVVTTVEFPEDLMEAPKCGDCADGTGGGALSRMEWNAQGRYLTIWPNTVQVEAVVLDEGENPQGPYEVTVYENGGKQRAVTRSVD